MIDSDKVAASIQRLHDKGEVLHDARRFNKTPTEHQWVKGQCGRPKYSADFCALVHALQHLTGTRKGVLRVLRTVDKSGEKIKGAAVGYTTVKNIMEGERYAPERASSVFRLRYDHYIATLGPVFQSGIEPSREQMTKAKAGDVAPTIKRPTQTEADAVEQLIQQRKAEAVAKRDAARAARDARTA
ncbi:hypothetical protein [Aeromonas sanarellii]|uniref:hypothetical protein n=1 Tax=Aeromonas sanarellii TaxID=633415 RepID=UPI003B9F7BA3